MIFDIAPIALIVIAVSFIIAGTVKGAIGAGLPTVCVPLIALVIDPAIAVSITIVPVLIANVWQSLQGGHYRKAFRSFWPFLVLLIVGVISGAQVLATADPRLTALILGAFLVVISLLQLSLRTMFVPEKLQPALNPVAGATCGLVGGTTGMFALTILYSAALRLPKDLLVSLLGMIALCGTLPLYVSLIVNHVLQWNELMLSALGFIPVAIGMVLGRRIRERISQRAFERAIFIGLAAVGVKLIYNGIV